MSEHTRVAAKTQEIHTPVALQASSFKCQSVHRVGASLPCSQPKNCESFKFAEGPCANENYPTRPSIRARREEATQLDTRESLTGARNGKDETKWLRQKGRGVRFPPYGRNLRILPLKTRACHFTPAHTSIEHVGSAKEETKNAQCVRSGPPNASELLVHAVSREILWSFAKHISICCEPSTPRSQCGADTRNQYSGTSRRSTQNPTPAPKIAPGTGSSEIYSRQGA